MPAPDDVPERVFHGTFALPAWVAIAGFGVAFPVLLLTAQPPGAPDTLTGALIAATLVTFLMAVLFHLAHCRVTASASALVVVQPAWRYVIPWAEVADVVVAGDGGMRIVLADRGGIAVFGFGGSVIGAFTGGIRARKARDGIKAVMAQAVGNAPARPFASESAIAWRTTLAAWAVLIALCLASWLMGPQPVMT